MIFRKKMLLAALLIAGALVLGLTSLRAPAALETGADAPDFSLSDKDGVVHQLSDNRGKWVALVFYPVDMTSGCTRQAQSIRDAKAELDKAGVSVFGISVQDAASKAKFCEAESLNYTLLADTEKKASEDYGVLLPSGVSARKTFIIDPTGKVAARLDDISVGTHGEDIARTVSGLKSTKAPRARVGAAIQPGKQAPLFNLPSATSNGMVALTDLLKKKPVTIIWVSVQCPVSNAYQPRMAQLAKAFPGVSFVGIVSNVTESEAAVAAHFKKAAMGFPVVIDRENIVADAYGAAVTPEAFVVGSDGLIKYHGAIDDSQDTAEVKSRYLHNALTSLLAKTAISPSQTKAFGCGIKRVKK